MRGARRRRASTSRSVTVACFSSRPGWLSSAYFIAQAIGLLVALRAQRLHGGPLAGIEQAHLDEGAVGVAAHLAAERVDLAHEMALGRPADRGVAGHQRDAIEVHRQQQRAASHARRRQRRLAARVARADDDHIVALVE